MLEITKQFQDRYSDLFKQDLSDLSEALKIIKQSNTNRDYYNLDWY